MHAQKEDHVKELARGQPPECQEEGPQGKSNLPTPDRELLASRSARKTTVI
jgi:hypothetical protein